MKSKMIHEREVIFISVGSIIAIFFLPHANGLTYPYCTNGSAPGRRICRLSDCLMKHCRSSMCERNGARIVDQSLKRNYCFSRSSSVAIRSTLSVPTATLTTIMETTSAKATTDPASTVGLTIVSATMDDETSTVSPSSSPSSSSSSSSSTTTTTERITTDESSTASITTTNEPTTTTQTTSETTTEQSTTVPTPTVRFSTPEPVEQMTIAPTLTTTTSATLTPARATPAPTTPRILVVDDCDGRIKISDFLNISFSDISGLVIDHRAEGVAYDSVERKVFWTDTMPTETICSAKLDGSQRQCTDISNYCNGVSRLDIDDVARKVYCACTGNNRILLMNVDGTGLQTFIDTITDVKFLLVTDGAVFFIEMGSKIKKRTIADYVTTSLYETTHDRLVCLANDPNAQKLYFSEIDTIWNNLKKMNYDGSNFESLMSRLAEPSDVVIFNGAPYVVEDGDIFAASPGTVHDFQACPDVKPTDIEVALM